MKLKDILKRIVPMRWRRITRDDLLSMVLLLRKPHFFSAEELQLAAERPWRVSFDGKERSSKHCVVQRGTVTMMKAGPHGINFLDSAAPYLGNPKENVHWLPDARQRQAWVEHSAYVAVDYLNRGVSFALGYAVLSKLVAEMLDGNCTGVYVPERSSLIPNDEALYLELQKLASSCDAGVRPKS